MRKHGGVVGPILRSDTTPAERKAILEALARILLPGIVQKYRIECARDSAQSDLTYGLRKTTMACHEESTQENGATSKAACREAVRARHAEFHPRGMEGASLGGPTGRNARRNTCCRTVATQKRVTQ